MGIWGWDDVPKPGYNRKSYPTSGWGSNNKPPKPPKKGCGGKKTYAVLMLLASAGALQVAAVWQAALVLG